MTTGLFAHRGLLDIPQACVLCDAEDRAAVCTPCAGSLRRSDAASACPVCAIPAPSGRVCGQCLSLAPHFDATIAAYHYAFPLDRLVQSFKFRADLKLAAFFSDALASSVASSVAAQERSLPSVVVALPLAKRRLRERGFNQAALLADDVAKRLHLSAAHDAMLRIRETPPQSGLTRDARVKNIRGAFDCQARLDGLHVAIVDDVMTTGATLSEAAKVLKRAGAARVDAWVLSRALLDSTEVAGND
jgi:ComF family protein